MCESCTGAAIKVIHNDYYETALAMRDEVLDTEDLQATYGEAYEELLQGYATFHQQVFNGAFVDESVIERRQQQWESQFDSLLNQIELYKSGETPPPDPEQKAEEGKLLRTPSKNFFNITPPPWTPSS